MKKSLAKLGLLICLMATISAAAQTNRFQSLRAQMSAAREASTVMMTRTDMRIAQQRQIVKDSVDAVSDKLDSLSAPTGKAKQLAELKLLWKDYRQTTIGSVLPAIQSNRDLEAQRLLMGVQRERFNRCLQLVIELGQP